MELRSLEMYNFGPFKDLQTLDIDPTPDLNGRPLTLVRAYNDVGKTSILKAMNFCLYGFGSHRSSVKIEERARAINRHAAFENDGEMYVKIKFRSDGDDYAIRRSITFKKTDTFAESPVVDKYTCVISKNENNILDKDSTEEEFWSSVKAFVGKILPEDVSQFFFFDGEKIQNYAQEEPTPAITTAVTKILGIQQIVFAKKDAEKNLLELKRKLRDEELADGEIHDDAEVVKEEEEKNENLRKEIDDDIIRIQNLQDNMRNNEAIIGGARRIKGLLDDRKKLTETEKDIELDIKKSREKRKQFNDENLVSYLLSLVFRGDSSDTNQIPGYVSKAAKWCLDREDCLCTRGMTESVSATLNKMVSEETATKEYAEYGIHHDILHTHGQTLPEKMIINAEEASELDERYHINQSALEDIKERIGAGAEEEEEKIKIADTQYNQDFGTVKQLTSDVDESGDKYQREKRRLDTLDDELTARSNSTKVRSAQANKNRCIQVIDALSEIIDTAVQNKRNDVQDRMSEYFLRITNRPEKYLGVVLDEDYRIKLVMREGPIDVWKIGPSSGASAMISFAFIAALNSMSAKQAPIFIDTPTGRLDPVHSENIIKFWPQFGKQVIILYQPNEISDQKIADLEDLIAYHYECKPKQGAEEESYLQIYGD